MKNSNNRATYFSLVVHKFRHLERATEDWTFLTVPDCLVYKYRLYKEPSENYIN